VPSGIALQRARVWVVPGKFFALHEALLEACYMKLRGKGPYIVGKEAIANRLGISIPQLDRLYRQAHFLMFKVPNFTTKPGSPNIRYGAKMVWATSEALITQWELMQCRKQHKEARAKRIKGK